MNILPWIVVLGLSIATLAGAVPPANHYLNQTSVPAGFETQSTPSIRSIANRAVAVWTDVRVGGTAENKFFYAVSSDSGATFFEAGQPPPVVNAGITYIWRSSPQLAIDPVSGRVFLAGSALSQSGPVQNALAVVAGTFNGNAVAWGTPTLLRIATTDILGGISLEVAPGGGSLHLLTADGGSIKYQRSTDGFGVVWSAPVVLSSAADLGGVAAPRLVAGVNSDLHAAWSGPFTMNNRPIRYRSSNNMGLAWNSEETAATMRVNPEYPGVTLLSPRRFDFSMAVNRVVGTGRVALAWAETWNFADDPFPPMTGTLIRYEVEPNGVPGTAMDFTPGDALIGFGNPTSDDIDLWRVTLAAGDGLLIWGDSTALGPRILVNDVNGTKTLIGGTAGTNTTAFVFRAPYSGSFYIQVQFMGNETQYYRLRTRPSSPGVNEAQDSRDLAYTFKDTGGIWAPVQHGSGPVGYDDYMPTLAFAADGLDYVHWYDFSQLPGTTATSHLVMKRGLLDQNPEAPAILTTQPTDWNTIFQFLPPGMGAANDMWRDPNRLFYAWADGRDQSPDAYAASLPTSAVVVSCPQDTTVQPNGAAILRIAVHNRNPLFQERVFAHVSGARSWPGNPQYPVSLIAEGTVGYATVQVDVPDTAALGVYPLTVTLDRLSGLALGSCPAMVTIGNVTAVPNPPASPFELRAIAPNPARGDVHVDFSLPERSPVAVAVYGIQGRRVRMLGESARDAGVQRITWDGRDDRGELVPTGVYFVKVSAPGHSARRSVLILR
jgi:hypothetical protein